MLEGRWIECTINTVGVWHVSVTCVCELGMSLRQCIDLSYSKSVYNMVTYSQRISTLRIISFPQMQNGQNPWGCASDDILELFKSEVVLDYRYDSHGDISGVSANTIRCGIHVLLNYCEYRSRRG